MTASAKLSNDELAGILAAAGATTTPEELRRMVAGMAAAAERGPAGGAPG